MLGINNSVPIKENMCSGLGDPRLPLMKMEALSPTWFAFRIRSTVAPYNGLRKTTVIVGKP